MSGLTWAGSRDPHLVSALGTTSLATRRPVATATGVSRTAPRSCLAPDRAPTGLPAGLGCGLSSRAAPAKGRAANSPRRSSDVLNEDRAEGAAADQLGR